MTTIVYLLKSVIAGISLVLWYLLGMIVGLLDQDRGLRIFINWNRFFLKLFGIDISLENENHATDTMRGLPGRP